MPRDSKVRIRMKVEKTYGIHVENPSFTINIPHFTVEEEPSRELAAFRVEKGPWEFAPVRDNYPDDFLS